VQQDAATAAVEAQLTDLHAIDDFEDDLKEINKQLSTETASTKA